MQFRLAPGGSLQPIVSMSHAHVAEAVSQLLRQGERKRKRSLEVTCPPQQLPGDEQPAAEVQQQEEGEEQEEQEQRDAQAVQAQPRESQQPGEHAGARADGGEPSTSQHAETNHPHQQCSRNGQDDSASASEQLSAQQPSTHPHQLSNEPQQQQPQPPQPDQPPEPGQQRPDAQQGLSHEQGPPLGTAAAPQRPPATAHARKRAHAAAAPLALSRSAAPCCLRECCPSLVSIRTCPAKGAPVLIMRASARRCCFRQERA